MKIIHDSQRIETYIKKYNIESWFTELSVADVKLLSYKQGEYMARSGEPLEYFKFFVKGRAKVYTVMQNGKSYLLSFYEPIQVIGDVELMNDPNMGCNCHVETLTPCTCIGIPMDLVSKKYLDDNTFLRAVGRSLAIKTFNESVDSSINLLYTLESRLAAYILALAPNLKEVQLNETYSDMAELLGTSYRHLARVLNKFSDEGLIEKSRKSIKILKPEGLKTYAGDLMLQPEFDNYDI